MWIGWGDDCGGCGFYAILNQGRRRYCGLIVIFGTLCRLVAFNDAELTVAFDDEFQVDDLLAVHRHMLMRGDSSADACSHSIPVLSAAESRVYISFEQLT